MLSAVATTSRSSVTHQRRDRGECQYPPRLRCLVHFVCPDALTNPELDSAQQALLDRYQSAFEKVDIVGLTALLPEDAIWESPPSRLVRRPRQRRQLIDHPATASSLPKSTPNPLRHVRPPASSTPTPPTLTPIPLT